jgi:hypothetical protein
MVAETVLRTTFACMATCRNQDEAIVRAINMLMYNALHISLLPVLQERFIKRVLQFEPLLGMAVLGITMKVPVVSMQSIMQLMNGVQVTNQTDLMAMRRFLQDSIAGNNMVQYMGMDGYASSGTDDDCLPGYVTCRCVDLCQSYILLVGFLVLLHLIPQNNSFFDGDDCFCACRVLRKAGAILQQSQGHQQHGQPFSSAGGASSRGSFSDRTGQGAATSPHGVPMEPIYQIIKVLYKNNEKTLKSCAFISDFFGFQRCVLALMKPFDLREFFGGMEAYHDGQRMASVLGVDAPFRFASNFVDGVNDQVMRVHMNIQTRICMNGKLHFSAPCTIPDQTMHARTCTYA